MKFASLSIVVCALGLAGCSTGLLGGGDPGPVAEQQIRVNNQLALPPDLSLKAPGTAPAPSVNPAPVSRQASLKAPADNIYGGNAAAPAPQMDVYEKYGVDKFNPDGSKKSDDQLRKELKLAIVAEKRKTNPNYGTIRNIGELFRDQ